MKRALARRLAAVSAFGLFVLASCEFIVLLLLFLMSIASVPVIEFEDFFYDDGVLYLYYQYPDGSYEVVAVSGSSYYSQSFNKEGRLIRVEDYWPGDNPSHPFGGFVDPVSQGLATRDYQTTTTDPGTPRGRSDASRGNPDLREEPRTFEPPPSFDDIPSEGSSEGSSFPG